MDIVAFVIDGIKYIATYKDNNLTILKLENNTLQELTTSENEKIIKLLNRKTGYKSNSELLTRLLTENNNIESSPEMAAISPESGIAFTFPCKVSHASLLLQRIFR